MTESTQYYAPKSWCMTEFMVLTLLTAGICLKSQNKRASHGVEPCAYVMEFMVRKENTVKKCS